MSKKTPTDNQYNLNEIESKIILYSENRKKFWLLIGQHLCEVQKFELFKQNEKYSSFSNWLNSFAKEIGKRSSTLWKYQKVVTMINELRIPHEDINLKTVCGLEQVARIFKYNKDPEEAFKYMKLLNEKRIIVSEIKKRYGELTTVVTIAPEVVPIKLETEVKQCHAKRFTIFTKKIASYLFSPPTLKTACVLVGFATVTPII